MIQEIQPDDEDDDQSVEAAIAAIMAESFATPPNPTMVPSADQVESILEATAGRVLTAYALRVLTRFLQTAGSSPMSYAVAEKLVPHAVKYSIDKTAGTVRQILDARAPEGRAPAGGDLVFEGGVTQEIDLYRRLTEGMQQTSRVLVTRTREEAKERIAQRVGALGRVWRTRRDAKVRVSHGDLEGDFRRFGVPFVTIHGEKLQRPGDPRAPLHETINCRCRLSYRVNA